MDRLDCDRMFVAVLDTGSFAEAARRLGVSSGQASKLVSRLESELGVQLLKRTTRALAATEVGQAYYERLKGLLDEFDALDASVRNASDTPAGRLRITAPLSFGTHQLTPLLLDFARAFPEVRFDVSFNDRTVNLVDEGFDLAVRIGKPADSSMMARKLCDIRVITVAAPAYIAKFGAPQRPGDLADHVCIIDTNFRDPMDWPFTEADGGVETVPVAGRLQFSNGEACLLAAIAGFGMARVPSFIAGPCIRDGKLQVVLEEYESEPHGLYAVYPPARHLAVKVRTFIDFLVNCFRGQPEWDIGW